MLSYVVAVGKNNVIGKDGTLPWSLPGDLQWFKDVTLSGSKTMIMGRKTFKSLGRVLPGRKHLILTQNKDYRVDHEDVEVIYSLEEIMPYANSQEEYFVIGGGEIFNMLFPYTDRMYLTEVHGNFEGDTFFPAYDKSEWKVTRRIEGKVDEENKHAHTYLVLDRIK